MTRRTRLRCFIGCPNCSSIVATLPGTSGEVPDRFIKPNCEKPALMEPTLPEKYRTWNMGNLSVYVDIQEVAVRLSSIWQSTDTRTYGLAQVRGLDEIPPLAGTRLRPCLRPVRQGGCQYR